MPKLKIDLVVDDKGSLVIKGFGNEVERVTWSSKAAFKGLATEIAYAGAALTAMTAAGGVLANEVIKITDKYTSLESKLKLVTNSSAELEGVQNSLYNLAKDSRQDYGATVELYARMARATEDAGTSQADLLTTTEAINKAMIISGATSTEANAAMIQLSQGLASGALRGDELRSVLEQTPRVARMVADGLGIAYGELREWGKEGKLTTEAVIGAIKDQAGTVGAEFEQVGRTVGQAREVFSTVFESIINDGGEAVSITETLSGAIIDFSDYLDDHRDDIREFFLGGVEAAESFGQTALPVIKDLWSGVAKVADGYNSLDPTIKQFGVILAVFGGKKGVATLAAISAASAAGKELSDVTLQFLGIEKQTTEQLGNSTTLWRKYDQAVGASLERFKAWYAESPNAQAFFGRQADEIRRIEAEITSLQSLLDEGGDPVGGFFRKLFTGSEMSDERAASIAKITARIEDLKGQLEDADEATVKTENLKAALEELAQFSFNDAIANTGGPMHTVPEAYTNYDPKKDPLLQYLIVTKEEAKVAEKAAKAAEKAAEEAAKAIRTAEISFSDALEVGWDDANSELVTYAGSTKKLKDIYVDLNRQLARGGMSDQDRIFADADREARRLLSSVDHLTEYTDEYNGELAEVRGMLIDVANQSEDTTSEMTDYWGSFAESTKDASKELFEKGIKGDIESLSEAAEIMADSVVDIFADMAAQIMANWVATGITGMFTGKGLGGFSMPSLSLGSGTGAVGTAATGVSIASAAGKISEWASNAGQYVAEALGLAAPTAAGYGVLASSGAAGSAASGASIYAASQAAAPTAFSAVPAGSYAGASTIAAPSAGVGAGASLAPLGMIAIPAIVAATLSFMSTGSSMAIRDITSQSGRDLSLTAFGSTLGEAESKYSDPYWVRAQVGAVSQYGVNTIGDMGSMTDVYTGMSDTIHGIFKAMRTDLDELAAASEGGGGQIEAITDSIATLDDKLEDTYTAMEIKATEYGDSVAALGLQMNQGVKEFDAFADAATGFDFSMDQSSWMMEQASLAADDNADAYNRLYQSLIGVTGSTEAAIAVTGDMVAAMHELSKVPTPTVGSGSASRAGYHPSNQAGAYSEGGDIYVPPVVSPPATGGRGGYHPNNPVPDSKEEKLVQRVVKAVSGMKVMVDSRVAVELDGRAVDARAKNVITKYVARKVGDGRQVF